jgi:hypothetical protein
MKLSDVVLNRNVVCLALVMVSNLVLAQTTNNMYNQINAICLNVKSVLPVIALLMFILSGGIYAIGQVMGAETRARATVWSTGMLLGGILGLIIAASAQFLMVTFMRFSIGDQVTHWEDPASYATYEFCGDGGGGPAPGGG